MVMSFPRNGLARVENEKVKKEVAKPGAIFLPPLQLISRKNAADPNNWEEADVWVIWFKWKESQHASNMMQQYLTTVEIACFVFKCGIWDRICFEERSFPFSVIVLMRFWAEACHILKPWHCWQSLSGSRTFSSQVMRTQCTGLGGLLWARTNDWDAKFKNCSHNLTKSQKPHICNLQS